MSQNQAQSTSIIEIVTSWMEEGIEKGLIQGKREGEILLLMRQLKRRVGEVPPELEQKIGGLEVAQLEELGLALLDFSSLSDLESWLQSQAA